MGGRITIRFRRERDRAQDGNVALAFGLLLPVLLAAGGAAIDIALYSSARSSLQEIADAAAIAGAMAAPIAAQAQSTITTGVGGGSTVVIGEHEGIVPGQRSAFREYIVRERVPNYTISERVIVGATLPETGVTYYDVPQTFGATLV